MGMPAKHSRRWSRNDVLALMEASPLQTPRYEVVRGELLVTPSPTPLHQFAVFELAKTLSAYCEATGIGETLISPSDVDLENGRGLVQPDVYVVAPGEGLRIRRENTVRILLLCAEVVSAGSVRGDRGPKRRLYHAAVPVYWTVDLHRREVEEWISGRQGVAVERERLTWLPSGADRPFLLALAAYFAKVHAD